MSSWNEIIDKAMNERHTDAGYLVRTGGHVKFFVDYDKAVTYFMSCCVNPEFGSMISRTGYIPDIRCEYHCMMSNCGSTSVEMRRVDEVDLVGTPKTWKSFNEVMEDMRKVLQPVVNELMQSLGIVSNNKKNK